jgi:hypothetical protein
VTGSAPCDLEGIEQLVQGHAEQRCQRAKVLRRRRHRSPFPSRHLWSARIDPLGHLPLSEPGRPAQVPEGWHTRMKNTAQAVPLDE